MANPTLEIPINLQKYFTQETYTPDEVALIWIKISTQESGDQDASWKSYPVNMDIVDFRAELAKLIHV